MRYEIRFINYGYGTVTTDSWETLEEVLKRYEEVKDAEIMGTIEIDEISIFDNELEEYLEVQ